MTQSQAPTGPCKLCGKVDVLQRSHIVSRWAYRRIVNTPNGHQTPVTVDDDVAILSGRQAAEYMLCGECEALIARREKYVSTIAVDATGTFPALKQTRPVYAHDATWKVADASSLDCDAIAYFAASVIWRASASSSFPNVRLGSYDAAFANYLLERTAFPKDSLLLVEFVKPIAGPNVDRIIVEPVSQRGEGCHMHHFTVFGLLFRLFVGRVLPKAFEPASFVRTKLVLHSTGSQLLSSVASKAKVVTPKGGLARRS